jgi:hypothetical protein
LFKSSSLGKTMRQNHLTIFEMPKMKNARMVVGLSGWMDGGEVSTGSIEYLVQKLGAWKCAKIDAASFYIYNFPGTMEVATLFRPFARDADGFVREFEPPENVFFADEANNLIFMLGKEPNLNWELYAECIFSFAAQADVETIYFVGSVAGLVGGGAVRKLIWPRTVGTLATGKIEVSLLIDPGASCPATACRFAKPCGVIASVLGLAVALNQSRSQLENEKILSFQIGKPAEASARLFTTTERAARYASPGAIPAPVSASYVRFSSVLNPLNVLPAQVYMSVPWKPAFPLRETWLTREPP